MKKKINIQEVDFEVYLDNALKSCGYLFPETDEQITIFEKDMDQIPIPKSFAVERTISLTVLITVSLTFSCTAVAPLLVIFGAIALIFSLTV